MVIGGDDAEFGVPWHFFYSLTVSEIWRWALGICYNDTIRSSWWKHDNNRFNRISDIRLFFCISRWHIFHLKMKTKLCGNLSSCRTLFVCLSALIIIENISRIARTAFEKTDYMYFHTPPGKAGKGSKNIRESNRTIIMTTDYTLKPTNVRSK